jgi:hypothetical protein
MRIKITKDYKEHKAGDIVEVSPNVAFGLIDIGVAKITKDMTSRDIKHG